MITEFSLARETVLDFNNDQMDQINDGMYLIDREHIFVPSNDQNDFFNYVKGFDIDPTIVDAHPKEYFSLKRVMINSPASLSVVLNDMQKLGYKLADVKVISYLFAHNQIFFLDVLDNSHFVILGTLIESGGKDCIPLLIRSRGISVHLLSPDYKLFNGYSFYVYA